MLLGNFKFIRRCIARKSNDLHSIQQWSWNSLQCIGCTDKKYIRQIKWDIHIVVSKGCILLRIKHLKKCTCRVSVVGSRKLIHLIKNHHRIRHSTLFDPVHNSSSHCTNISPSVSTDIGLISHTTKTYSHILPAHSLCNALPNTCLSCSWCPDKEKNRTRLLFCQIHHRNLLNNAILYLL